MEKHFRKNKAPSPREENCKYQGQVQNEWVQLTQPFGEKERCKTKMNTLELERFQNIDSRGTCGWKTLKVK